MNLVIDTNIVFSALLNTKSNIGELLLNYQDKVTFYAPEFLILEVEKYSTKIKQYSKLTVSEILFTKSLIFSSIKFISVDLILNENWEKAFELISEIDEKDTPFVALALQMNCKIWTGDKKLVKGLETKNSHIIFTTHQLKEYLEK